jgi:hypothetical protein
LDYYTINKLVASSWLAGRRIIKGPEGQTGENGAGSHKKNSNGSLTYINERAKGGEIWISFE